MKSLISDAKEFALEKHKHQKRTNGTPYFAHLERVANLVKEMGCDDEIIAAAYLHDSVEDVGVTLKELSELFGDRVATLVADCTNDYSDNLPHTEKMQAVYKHAQIVGYDAKHIKVADRWDNLNDLSNWKSARILRYCENTRWLYKGLDGIPEKAQALADATICKVIELEALCGKPMDSGM